MEARSINDEFSLSPKDHCYIKVNQCILKVQIVTIFFTYQDWAIAGDIHKLKMHWHIPNDEELKLVDRFLEEFLEPELIRLRAFMNGEPLERYVCT